MIANSLLQFKLKLLEKFNIKLPTNNKEKHLNFVWCLVGNIKEQPTIVIDNNSKNGTSHFTPNSKVFCLPAQWADAYEKCKVIGRQRKTNKNICMIIPTNYITNWRIQKVYKPYILIIMQAQNGWTNSYKDKNTILKMIEFLTEKDK